MTRFLNLFTRLVIVAGCFLLASADGTDVRAATYFVRASGNDANDGKLPLSAFQTIKKAAKVVESGDQVFVGAGAYTDDIILNGVQQSTLRVEFIADTQGTFTGDAGEVIVSGARWKVVNSNYVSIKGFQFRGATSRFLVWKGSYEGLLEDCVFQAGDEGLLVKDGSLTLQGCRLQGFTQDGLQVDGEARLVLRDSTISGCQQSGLEIRKVAQVVLDNCIVDGNIGDGLEVNIVTDAIDPGPDGHPGWKGRVPLAGADGPISMSGNSFVEGDLHRRPEYPVDPNRVSGSVYDIPPAMSFPPVDPGDADINNDNANLPLGPNDELVLSGSNVVDVPAGTYYLSEISISGSAQLRVLGPTVIYVTGEVKISGNGIANQTGDPSNLQIFPLGGGSFNLSGNATLEAAVYAPNTEITVTGNGGIAGMVIGEQLNMSGNGKLQADESLFELAESLIPAPPSFPSPPSSWTPVSSGEVDVSASAFTNNGNGARMVTEQPFNARFTDFSNNAGWGLSLWGASRVDSCTINDNSTGGIWLNQLTMADLNVRSNTLANNVEYGVFAQACQLTFDSTNIGDWSISGSQYAIAGEGSNLVFDSVSISGGSVAAVRSYQGDLTAYRSTFTGSGYGLAAEESSVALYNCTFSYNTVGLYAHQNAALLARDSVFTRNTLWGSAVYGGGAAGTATFENCSIDNNAGGLTVVDAASGEVALRAGTVIRDNTNAGIHFDNCNLTVSDQNGGANWRVLRNRYSVSSYQSQLTLSNVLLEDSTSYGVYSQSSDVRLLNSTVNGRYGVFADASNNSLTVEASRLNADASLGWGLVRFGGNVDVKNTILKGYWGGIYLYTLDATRQANVLNATVVDANGYGIYVSEGAATVHNTILTGDGSGYGLTRMNGAQLTHANNLLHNFNTPYLGTSAGADEIDKNPRFLDAPGGNYRLGVGSPAINAGRDLGAQVATDLVGNARPLFKTFDIGAYEYTDPNGSLRVLTWNEAR